MAATLDTICSKKYWSSLTGENFAKKVVRAEANRYLADIRWYASELSTTPLKEAVYTYDAIGRRVEKKVSDYTALSNVRKTFTRRYIYDSQEILAELDGGNNLLARYTHSNLRTDSPLSVYVTQSGVNQAVAASAGSYFYLADALGTIKEITDNAGTILQRYQYSAFGQLLSIKSAAGVDITETPTVSTPFTFTGREFDPESELFYYRARNYDPGTGRFLQQDPHPGSIGVPITTTNRYAYVSNNPININDPSGMSWLGDFFGGKGGWGADLITAVVTGTVLVAAGVSFGAAALAVGSIAGGALAASISLAAFQHHGDFWENIGNNFHSFFRVSAAFLAGSAIFAPGGVASAGGNGLQGWVTSNKPYFGEGTGLTIGSASTNSLGSDVGPCFGARITSV